MNWRVRWQSGSGPQADHKSIKKQIQNKRWQLRLATGFKPEKMTLPNRFTELTTWKGTTDINYLNALKSTYAQKINEMLEA
jgi:aldehyde:ferredoxin oxidoreductase